MARGELWTARQRIALLAILCALFAALLITSIVHPVYVSDPQPSEPSRAAELQDGIDPNTADEDSMAALPTIGPKRAKLIVEYRNGFRARLGRNAFERPEDLMKVKGIGAATVDQVRPFLRFPTTQPISPTVK